MAIALLCGTSDSAHKLTGLGDPQQLQEEQKSDIAVIQKQVQLSTLLTQKFTSVPLTSCLVYELLTTLIKE